MLLPLNPNQVVRIGRAQQFVTFSRALAAYAAAAALPWVWVVREKVRALTLTLT